MKQTRVDEYRPNYPKKLLKGAALTAAVMLTLSPSLGCRQYPDPHTTGAISVPEPTDEPELDGEIMVDESTPEPDGGLILDGEVAIDEPTPDPGEEPEWMGDVVADPTEP